MDKTNMIYRKKNRLSDYKSSTELHFIDCIRCGSKVLYVTHAKTVYNCYGSYGYYEDIHADTYQGIEGHLCPQCVLERNAKIALYDSHFDFQLQSDDLKKIITDFTNENVFAKMFRFEYQSFGEVPPYIPYCVDTPRYQVDYPFDRQIQGDWVAAEPNNTLCGSDMPRNSVHGYYRKTRDNEDFGITLDDIVLKDEEITCGKCNATLSHLIKDRDNNIPVEFQNAKKRFDNWPEWKKNAFTGVVKKEKLND